MCEFNKWLKREGQMGNAELKSKQLILEPVQHTNGGFKEKTIGN